MTDHDATERDAITMGMALVGQVRAMEPELIAHLLSTLSRPRLEAAAVALAAMVDDSKPVSKLLEWLEFPAIYVSKRMADIGCDEALWGRSVGSAALHGTRSRYNVGCFGAACSLADREYQAKRPARRKTQRTRLRSVG